MNVAPEEPPRSVRHPRPSAQHRSQQYSPLQSVGRARRRRPVALCSHCDVVAKERGSDAIEFRRQRYPARLPLFFPDPHARRCRLARRVIRRLGATTPGQGHNRHHQRGSQDVIKKPMCARAACFFDCLGKAAAIVQSNANFGSITKPQGATNRCQAKKPAPPPQPWRSSATPGIWRQAAVHPLKQSEERRAYCSKASAPFAGNLRVELALPSAAIGVRAMAVRHL